MDSRSRGGIRHSGGRRRALRPHDVGARRLSRSRDALETLLPHFRRFALPEHLREGPLVPVGAFGASAARHQRRPDAAGARPALGVVPRHGGRAAPPAPAPLVSGRVRARAPLAPAHAGAAPQPRAQRAQQVSGAAACRAAGARAASGGRRQGGASSPRGGCRGRLLLRVGAGIGPRGGGDADPQLCAPSAQPNGQVLHVLRAAAPSSQ